LTVHIKVIKCRFFNRVNGSYNATPTKSVDF